MLITDRSYADCERAAQLLSKVQHGRPLTAAEQVEYDAGLKGCYNASDLNRVEEECRILADAAGLAITTKTDWAYNSILTEPEVIRILDNLTQIRDAAKIPDELPALGEWIDYKQANNIERMLQHAGEIIKPVLYTWDVYAVIVDQKIIDQPGGSGIPTYNKPPNRVCYTGARITGSRIELFDVLNGGKAMSAYQQSDALEKANSEGKKLYYATSDAKYRYKEITMAQFVSSYLAVVQIIDTKKSKGSYIKTITSADPAAYPADGIQGDYWYIKKEATA